MRRKSLFTWSMLLAIMLLLGSGCASLQKPEKPEWQFHSIVDVAFVQPYAVVPQPDPVPVEALLDHHRLGLVEADVQHQLLRSPSPPTCRAQVEPAWLATSEAKKC